MYAESFEFNLTGLSLPTIQINQLAHLGVRRHADQKAIMVATRHLIDAFARKERAAKANEMWANLLHRPRSAGSEASDLSSMVPPRARSPPGGGFGGGFGGKTSPRRRQGGGSVVVARGSAKYEPPPMPIHLHLPKIAQMHAHQQTRSKEMHVKKGNYATKPSVIPPAASGTAHDGQPEWKELAKSYGLHLLPENSQPLPGDLAQPRNTNPHMGGGELQGGMAGAYPGGAYAGGGSGGPSLYGKFDLRTDLGASPSLPMLSPGRVGARNWVTFLHG